MILLKTYTQPTTIYIVGNDFGGLKETFSLTDDYMSLLIKSGSQQRFMETDGFCFIMTEQEFNERKDDLDDSSYQDFIKIENFEGDIHVKVIDNENNEILEEDATLDDYLMHQTKDDAEFSDVVIVLPDGYELPQVQNLEEIM